MGRASMLVPHQSANNRGCEARSRDSSSIDQASPHMIADATFCLAGPHPPLDALGCTTTVGRDSQ